MDSKEIIKPMLWEIEDLNEEIRKCKKRRLCRTRTNALLYNNSVREDTINNYRKLKVLLMDCKWFPVCPMKKFYEEGKLDKKWIELYCRGDWESCVRYQMEERGELHPDWMLPDGSTDLRLGNYIRRR